MEIFIQSCFVTFRSEFIFIQTEILSQYMDHRNKLVWYLIQFIIVLDEKRNDNEFWTKMISIRSYRAYYLYEGKIMKLLLATSAISFLLPCAPARLTLWSSELRALKKLPCRCTFRMSAPTPSVSRLVEVASWVRSMHEILHVYETSAWMTAATKFSVPM